MKQQSLFSFSLLLLFFLHCTKSLAQSPAAAPATTPPTAPAKAPAAAPATTPPTAPAKSPAAATPQAPVDTSTQASPPVMVPVQVSKGPVNVIKILQKAGHFNFFLRLIKTTQEDIQLFSQLNDSSDGVTIFAPTDGAFSAIIKSGTLNSLTDQEKIELVQFHLLARFISTPQFQTVSNPLKTLAGAGNRFALNITTTDSFVNVSTGLTNTSVSGIVYTDGKLAIYQVDKVLLPLDLFATKSPAPAPKPLKPQKAEGAESPVVPKDTSDAVTYNVVHNNLIIFGVGMVAAIFSL